MRRTSSFSIAAIAVIAAAGSARAQVGRNPAMVDPNLATEQQLLALPHLSAALVKGLLERRPFASITELNALLSPSLSKDQLTELYGRTFVHINLNTTTRDQILLIPGVGNRMALEFLEYRPYKALAQFHREIKKYVDEKEVTRLEGYVFVPVDLNSATDEDILSIPGVGQRMLHEFKEYRPYPNIEKFRREIGKYVNAKEVGRLERYLTLQK